MAEILRQANLPQGFDPALHKAARTGRNGRVKKNQRPVVLANEAQVRAYARKQRALVGTAKAGWGCAAKALGGRNRRNLRDATGGNRATAERLPAYVRALMRKFPDLGGPRALDPDSTVTIEIFTNVKHAAEAIPPRLYASVTSSAQASLAVALNQSLRALNQQQFNAA